MKKVLSVVLALAMILTTLSVMAFAAPTSLQAMIDAAADGATVTWTGDDIKLTDTVKINKSVTVNLRGAVIRSADDKSAFEITAGDVTIRNGYVLGEYSDIAITLDNAMHYQSVLDELKARPAAIAVKGGNVTLEHADVMGNMMYDRIVQRVASEFSSVDTRELGIPVGAAVSLTSGKVIIKSSALFGRYAVYNAGGTVEASEGFLVGYLGALKNGTVTAINGAKIYDAYETSISVISKKVNIPAKISELLDEYATGTVLAIGYEAKDTATVDYANGTATFTAAADNSNVKASVSQRFSYAWIPESVTVDGVKADFVADGDSYTASISGLAEGTYNAKIRYRMVVYLDPTNLEVQYLSKILNKCESVPSVANAVLNKFPQVRDVALDEFEDIMDRLKADEFLTLAIYYDALYDLYYFQDEQDYELFMFVIDYMDVMKAKIESLGLTKDDITEQFYDQTIPALIALINEVIGTNDELLSEGNTQINPNFPNSPEFPIFVEPKGEIGQLISFIRDELGSAASVEEAVNVINNALTDDGVYNTAVKKLPDQIRTLKALIDGDPTLAKILEHAGYTELVSKLGKLADKLDQLIEKADSILAKQKVQDVLENPGYYIDKLSEIADKAYEYADARISDDVTSVTLVSSVVNKEFEAVEPVEADGNLTYSVEGNGVIRVVGVEEEIEDSYTDAAVTGVVYSAVAEADGDETFLFWAQMNPDGKARIVSFEAELDWTFGTTTELTAFFTTDEAVTYVIDPWNTIVSTAVTSVPAYVGFERNADADEIVTIGNATLVYAAYEASKYYTVSVEGNASIYEVTYVDDKMVTTGEAKTSITVKEGTYVALVANDASFTAWTVNGVVISTAAVYGLVVTDNMTVVADTVEVNAPVIGIKGSRDDSGNAVFAMTREVGEGFTMIEAGILLAVTDTVEISLENYLAGNSGILRGVTNDTSPNGTYIVTKGNSATAGWSALGYLIYTDGENVYTIYTDIVSA